MVYSVVSPLAEALDKASGLNFGLFRQALEGFEVPSAWLDEMLEDLGEGEGYHRILLYGGDGYEIVLAVWPHGTATLVHDHGSSNSFGMVKVLKGDIYNHLYHQADDKSLEPGEKFTCRPGDMIEVPKGLLHRMGNACEKGPAASLHLYSPAIVDVSYWDPRSLEPCQ